jgi:chaperonin GroEL
MKSVSQKTNEEVGDGTTSTIILTKNILDACFSKVDGLVSSNVMELSRKVKKDCEDVVARLSPQVKKVNGKEDLRNIAMTSVENEEIAEMIADIFDKVGKDGFATIEDADGFKTTYEIKNGYEMGYGCASKEMVMDVKKANILIFNRLVNSINYLSPFTNSLAGKGVNDLVVFAKDFSDEVLGELNLNILSNNFKVLAIRCGEDEMKDISALTGASIITTDDDKPLIGNADIVSSSVSKTSIAGGVGDTSKRVEELRKDITSSKFDEEFVNRKIAQLTSGVGIIKVGAKTDEEREYLKYKIEDAVSSTKSALQEGFVIGAGRALLKVSEELTDNILKEPIKSVYNQVVENKGNNTIPDNVIDSFKVVKTTLENACSLASVVLTAELAIAEKNVKRTLENEE